MPNAIDLSDKQFGRLKVVGVDSRRGRRIYWKCLCRCGTEVAVRGSHLTSGATLSCGCLHSERSSARTPALHRANTKTGLSGTPTNGTWLAMKQRCLNPNSRYFVYYGGRGITVCERWMKFENFLADMGVRPPGMTLDRIDNSRGYEPGNCRWVSRTVQQNNQRTNHMLTYMGRTATMAEWARDMRLTQKVLSSRIYAGWSVGRALTTPARSR